MVRLSLLISLSFFIVAFGAPSLSESLSVCAAAFGYALFWLACLRIPRRRFWIGLGWFGCVQAVQLSWLTSLEYMGPMILGVYGLLTLGLGLQFGFLTTLIRPPLCHWQMFGLAGFWVLLEWIRLFFLTGFTWNPIGLSLAANSLSIQFASLFGIYGLCFWVVWVNLLALRALLSKQNKAAWAIWVFCALLPYGYGVLHRNAFRKSQGRALSVALVQTALRPEQRDFLPGKSRFQMHPVEQWDRILFHIQQTKEKKFDLIVLPEGALPYGARNCIYPIQVIEAVWERHFGAGSKRDFPSFETPFAHLGEDGRLKVSNAFLLQGLSNHFGADVIAGLDDYEKEHAYNAAFYFAPNQQKRMDRYEKKILIPVAEYVPFYQSKWLVKFIADQFGIENSFCPGKGEKIFQGCFPIGVFICLEETYSYFVRNIRQAGAQLFVNITNDVWFPDTRLPWHHFDHGRLRAVENGVCLLRACNTGVTSAIDCYGDPVAIFPVSDQVAGVLNTHLLAYSFSTFYSFGGDLPILIFSSGGLFFFTFRRVRLKKKLP